jgi:hypothetical protein
VTKQGAPNNTFDGMDYVTTTTHLVRVEARESGGSPSQTILEACKAQSHWQNGELCAAGYLSFRTNDSQAGPLASPSLYLAKALSRAALCSTIGLG